MLILIERIRPRRMRSNKPMERVSPVILSGDEGCENAHRALIIIHHLVRYSKH
jgi:hypothetical protein